MRGSKGVMIRPDEPHPVEVRGMKLGYRKVLGQEWYIPEWQRAKFKYFLPSIVPFRNNDKHREMGSG